jgi:hypothetical protein
MSLLVTFQFFRIAMIVNEFRISIVGWLGLVIPGDSSFRFALFGMTAVVFLYVKNAAAPHFSPTPE